MPGHRGQDQWRTDLDVSYSEHIEGTDYTSCSPAHPWRIIRWVQSRVRVKQRRRRDCERFVFQTDDIQNVSDRFREIRGAFIGHELTRNKFSTASEEFTAE